MENNRTENSIKNVKTGFILQLINKITSFVVRTIFISYLGVEYLGINGLFSNILTVLSFAELGIGTAIIYNMYKPIAEHDNDKVSSLMKLYKKAYISIGCIVFLLGLVLIPFFPYLINEKPAISENIIYIYVMFLLNTSLSYFYSYNKSIIIANQKQSIINNVDSTLYLIKCILSIVILIIFKNYILYLLIEILFTFSENIIVSNIAKKMYPQVLNGKTDSITKDEKKNIFKNVKSLVIYKFGSVIMNGTDNILISSMINISFVGFCSNYTLIISSINSVLSSSLNGIVGSVGNLNAIATKEKKEEVFYELNFIYYILYSFCTISLIILLNPFINLWLGKDYILDFQIPLALSISFFIAGMREPGYIYRTTLGMFNKSRLTPYIAAISNIVLSILLCKKIGLAGIFYATCISQLISYSWIDPFLIYKYEFKKSSKIYFFKILKYILLFIIELGICIIFANFNFFNNIFITFIYKVAIVILIPNIINILLLKNTFEFDNLYKKFFLPQKKKY